MDVKALNKRLEQQIKQIGRGLTYVKLELLTARLFVFVNGLFANNKDLSSQIGFEIILANKTIREDEFILHRNLIYQSFIKSKRVKRSVLASKIYGIVAGADMSFAISSTLKIITKQLQLLTILIIICTDLYSLYKCLVKLRTTKEKRLIIDIIALWQSYKPKELFKIRWINS